MVLSKDYLEKKNTWELALTILHFCKFIRTFYRNHPERTTAIFPLIDSIPPIARPIFKPKAEASSTKKKHGQLSKINNTNKYVKQAEPFSFLSYFWSHLNNRQKISLVIWFPLQFALQFDFSIFLPFGFFFERSARRFFPINNSAFLIFLNQIPKWLEVFHR